MVWLKRSLGVSLLLLLALAVFWTLSARQRQPLAVAANPAAPPIAALTLVAYPILLPTRPLPLAPCRPTRWLRQRRLDPLSRRRPATQL